MLNHETHEIDKISCKRTFSFRTRFRVFRAFCMPWRSEMETGGKNKFICRSVYGM